MQGTFYLGANTPQGFFSYYDELNNAAKTRKYIIKGGPGTGKSSFMRKFADTAKKGGESVEYIICSSDPHSLDAVVLIDRGISFVDGTAPHIVDPVYPGAYDEIINLGGFWNVSRLKNARENIEQLNRQISESFKGAYRYLSAAKHVEDDIGGIISGEIDYDRMIRLASRISKTEFGSKAADEAGSVSSRFISGVTPLGINHYLNENLSSFERIYNIYDPFKIGGLLIKKLSDAAVRAGHDVINCYCPMSPDEEPEHVIIEDLSLAFVTSNTYHRYEGDAIRRINLERYVSEDVRRDNRQKLKFNHKLKASLVNRAIDYIKEAKALHDILETNYIKAMDFKKINSLQSKLLTEIIV